MITVTARQRTPKGPSIAKWRLLSSRGLSGAQNMALDEALLESVREGGLPAVRFYTWEPPTLSLGVNQSVHEVNRSELERRGFGLVRRLTGGRAVLHHHEITYSVAALENDERVSGGVLESYRKISAALVDGLRALGADVSLVEPRGELFREMAAARRASAQDPSSAAEISHGAVCFDTSSAYELDARGRKLVGSAQARRGGAILQHGSILLDVDWDAWASAFAYRSERGRERVRASLPARMTSLSQELGRKITADEVEDALSEAFERALRMELVRGDLTDEERCTVDRLEGKYAGAEWNEKS